MLTLKSRTPVKRKGGTLVYYKVVFKKDTDPHSLFTDARIIDTRNRRNIKGHITGVEATSVQLERGIKAGESVVIALFPE